MILEWAYKAGMITKRSCRRTRAMQNCLRKYLWPNRRSLHYQVKLKSTTLHMPSI